MTCPQNFETDKFVFFRSYYEGASELPDNERLAFYDALISYALCGKVPECNGIVKAMFVLAKPNIDKSHEMKESRAQSGKTGADKRWNKPIANASASTECKADL